MSHPSVHLSPLTEDGLGPLLDAASTADPLEVMPPVADTVDGWTERRRQAFLAFHRRRSLSGTAVETTHVVRVDGRVVGAGRVHRVGDVAEVGLWLAPQWRGAGIGTAVAAQLLDLARQAGCAEVMATTTPDNAGALAVLGRNGARLHPEGDAVRATWPSAATEPSAPVPQSMHQPPRRET